MAFRKIQSRRQYPAWFQRIALGEANSTAPVLGSLYLKPSAVPSGTAAKGDFYVDSTNNNFAYHDGTVWRFASGNHVLTLPIAATSVDAPIFIASRALVVESAKEIHNVVGGASAALMIRKCTTTTAPASGTAIATGSFDLTATINTTQTMALSATAADYTLAAGDKLAFDFTGTLTGLVGVVTIVLRVA